MPNFFLQLGEEILGCAPIGKTIFLVPGVVAIESLYTFTFYKVSLFAYS